MSTSSRIRGRDARSLPTAFGVAPTCSSGKASRSRASGSSAMTAVAPGSALSAWVTQRRSDRVALDAGAQRDPTPSAGESPMAVHRTEASETDSARLRHSRSSRQSSTSWRAVIRRPFGSRTFRSSLPSSQSLIALLADGTYHHPSGGCRFDRRCSRSALWGGISPACLSRRPSMTPQVYGPPGRRGGGPLTVAEGVER